MATQNNGGHDQNANLDGDVEAAGEEERAIEGDRAQARNETLQAVVAETPRPQRQERQNPRIRYAENGHLMMNEEEPSMLTCGIVSSTNLLKIFVLIYWFTTLLSFVVEGDDAKAVFMILPLLIIFTTMIAICNENWMLLFPFLVVLALQGAFHAFRAVALMTSLPLNGLEKTDVVFEHMALTKNSEPNNVLAFISAIKALYSFIVVISVLEVQLLFWNKQRMRGFRAERAALHRDLVNQHVVNMVNNMGRDVPDVQPARPVERPPSYTAVVGSGNYRVTMRRASQSTTESLVETAPPSYSQILVRKELKSESSTE